MTRASRQPFDGGTWQLQGDTEMAKKAPPTKGKKPPMPMKPAMPPMKTGKKAAY